MNDEELAGRAKHLRGLIGEFGQEAYARRATVAVRTLACLETGVPRQAGVYWIETDMPIETLQDAICQVKGKSRRVRKNPPKGGKLLLQEGSAPYVAYTGTEQDLQKRLAQHLFNRGSERTVRLGCMVDQPPFSDHTWRVSFTVIEDQVVRYAVEAWWRLEVGWPVFSLR